MRSRKPVLWLPGAEMFYPDGTPRADPLYTIRRRGHRTMKTIARSLVGERNYARLKSLLGTT